jgi:hypothetical protein
MTGSSGGLNPHENFRKRLERRIHEEKRMLPHE